MSPGPSQLVHRRARRRVETTRLQNSSVDQVIRVPRLAGRYQLARVQQQLDTLLPSWSLAQPSETMNADSLRSTVTSTLPVARLLPGGSQTRNELASFAPMDAQAKGVSPMPSTLAFEFEILVGYCGYCQLDKRCSAYMDLGLAELSRLSALERTTCTKVPPSPRLYQHQHDYDGQRTSSKILSPRWQSQG